MTVPGLLLDLLRRAEADLPGVEILTADEVSPWPAGALEALVQKGFLSPTTPGTSVLCDACLEDHWQDVEFIESPPGTHRAYIVCPEAGRVAVDTARLNRWRVDVARLAGFLGQLLDCTEAPDELVASRLWRLGRTKLAGESRDAFLVRGLTWSNAGEALRLEQRLSHGASSLLLTPVEIIADPPAGTSVVALTRVLSLADNRLSLDLPYIEAVIVSDADRFLAGSNMFRKQGEYWTIGAGSWRHVSGSTVCEKRMIFWTRGPGHYTGSVWPSWNRRRAWPKTNWGRSAGLSHSSEPLRVYVADSGRLRLTRKEPG